MGLRSGMWVSDGSPIGLQWFFDQACRSLMGLPYISDESPIILLFSWTHFTGYVRNGIINLRFRNNCLFNKIYITSCIILIIFKLLYTIIILLWVPFRMIFSICLFNLPKCSDLTTTTTTTTWKEKSDFKIYFQIGIHLIINSKGTIPCFGI